MNPFHIETATAENISQFNLCGFKGMTKPGQVSKVNWLKDRMKEGLKYNILYHETQGECGMIEFIPAEFAWRPVNAPGYLFIHCMVIIPKAVKNKGGGKFLLQSCLDEAIKTDKNGIAVITRKSSFMAGNDIFLKNGYRKISEVEPDFELLALKLKENAINPEFRNNWDQKLLQHKGKLIIYYADQCPYINKAVEEISESARVKYQLNPELRKITNCIEAQDIPAAFGTFCIIYDSKVIAEHPISNTRFENIMNKLKK